MAPEPAEDFSAKDARLYYDQPYLTDFTASVTHVRQVDSRTYAALDRTAFYPTGGGQPHDTGTLGGWRVDEVIADDGLVWHVLAGDAELTVGQVVEGRVDWARRFDHMQQHAGQHILSAALERLYGYATVGFHLGADTVTIDVDTEKADAAELQAAEDLANTVIWQDVPIATIWTHDAAAAPSHLRRPPSAPPPWRLVQIGDFDICPCGGTHPRRSGEIGSLFIVKTERAHGVVRVHFVAGGRALRWWREEHGALSAAGRLLSVGATAVPEAVERVLSDNQNRSKSLMRLKADLTALRADLMRARAPRLLLPLAGEETIVVAEDVPDASHEELKALATAVTAPGSAVAVLGTRDAGGGFLVLARSVNRPWDLRELTRDINAVCSGRGGGSPSLCQVSLPADQVAKARAMAEAWLQSHCAGS